MKSVNNCVNKKLSVRVSVKPDLAEWRPLSLTALVHVVIWVGVCEEDSRCAELVHGVKTDPWGVPETHSAIFMPFKRKMDTKYLKWKGKIHFNHQFLNPYMQNHYSVLTEHFSLLFPWFSWKGKNPGVLSKHILNRVQVPTSCFKATNN